jgi:hypothetical protein
LLGRPFQAQSALARMSDTGDHYEVYIYGGAVTCATVQDLDTIPAHLHFETAWKTGATATRLLAVPKGTAVGWNLKNTLSQSDATLLEASDATARAHVVAKNKLAKVDVEGDVDITVCK